MTGAIEVREQPDERELREARREVEALEGQFAEIEVELASATAALEAFRTRYTRRVGEILVELHRLEAEIARRLADLNPDDPERQEQATKAEHAAKDSQERAERAISDGAKPDAPRPDENLTRLRKRAAKLLHPDLATDDADQRARTVAMAEANAAYEARDGQRLQAVIDAWENGHPTPDAAANRGEELERLRRRAALLRTAIDNARDHLNRIGDSDLAQLKERVTEADAVDHDLLAEIKSELLKEVADAGERLASLV